MPSQPEPAPQQPDETSNPSSTPAPLTPDSSPRPAPVTVSPPGLSLPESIPAPPSRAGAPAGGSGPAADSTPSSGEPLGLPSPQSGSSRESSTGEPRRDLSAVLSDLFSGLVSNAGVLAHEHLTTNDEQRQVGLWLADETDTEGIAEPATSLLSRRGLGGNLSGDAADLTDLATAVVGYAMKQLTKLAVARSWRKQRQAQAQADPATQTISGQVIP